MRKKEFYSQLFRQKIHPTDVDYYAKVHAELLFRISELEKAKCTCMQCQNDLAKYKAFLDKNPNPYQR